MRIVCLGLVLMLLVVLAGCGVLGRVTPPATPAPTLESLPTEVETAAEPTPTPSEPPAPSPTITTAQASAAPTPVVVLTQKDYYVVEQNQRAGVVDKTGRVVLPFAFSTITKLGAYYWDNAGVTNRDPAAFFLGVPYQIKQDGASQSGTNNNIATLYNADGRAVTGETYLDGYWLDDDLMALGRSSTSRGWGVLDTQGRTVIPFQYTQVRLFSRYLVGSDEDNKKMDFYDHSGKLQKTVTGSPGYAFQNYYMARDDKGRPALLDEELQWHLLGDYQYVDPLAADRFRAYDGIVSRVIDARGKDVLPKPYQSIEATLDKDGKLIGYVCASDAVPTVAAYNAEGKLIFESSTYTGLRAFGPYYIAYYSGGSHVLDAKGRRILTDIEGNAENWREDTGLFESYNRRDGGVTFVRPDGTTVPLPANRYAQSLSAERFIVSVDDTRTGISDARGHWVVPPDYAGFYQMHPGDKTLLVTQADGLSGIMDYDGKWLLPPVFDSVYGQLDGLLQAQKGDRGGLLDWTGHWVWSTSAYDALDD